MKKKVPLHAAPLTLVILGLVLIFTSCATLKKDDCLTADWYQIGYEDGTKGHPASRFAKHKKACAKYEVTPILDIYLDGRDEGLRQFCTPYNAYRLGIRGKSYQNQCAAISPAEFIQAYNRGRDVYLFKQQISREKNRLKNLKSRLELVNAEIDSKEQELVRDCSDKDKCKQILDDIRALDDEKQALENDIAYQKEQITDMEDTLSVMESQNHFF